MKKNTDKSAQCGIYSNNRDNFIFYYLLEEK